MDNKTKNLVYVSLCSIIIVICSWIYIPTAVPFTLQTFAIYLAIFILGAKLGTLSILLYIFLGIIGLPVFSGFKSGIAALTGPTGGYIIGFIITGLIMLAFESLFNKNKYSIIISSIIGLIVCYLFGTIWFIKIFTTINGSISLAKTLGMCVIPFIIPDILKISFAYILSAKISRILNLDTSFQYNK